MVIVKRNTSAKAPPEEKKILSRAAKQKLVRRVPDLGIGYDEWEFEEFDVIDDIDVGIFKNPKTGNKVMFTIDPEDQEVIFYKKINPSQPTTFTTVDHVESATDKDALSPAGYYHPMATVLFSMSEERQKQWWKDQKFWVQYDGDSNMLGKVIGFQKTDTGHIGAIVADRHNTRVLYGMSFKTGTPFVLGRPKPRKVAD